ncbi:MAG: hypothetical protein WDN46_19055 [Methylocella sp.]
MLSDNMIATLRNRATSLDIAGLEEAIVNRIVELDAIHSQLGDDPECDVQSADLEWRYAALDMFDREFARRCGSPGSEYRVASQMVQ